MTEIQPPAPSERTSPLYFRGHPISFLLLDGTPYFSLTDIRTAMAWSVRDLTPIEGPDFTALKRDVEELHADGNWRPATVLGASGIWLLGHLVDAGRSQLLSAFIRREAVRLCPNPRHGDPAMFLSPLADGTLPPRPLPYSGWLSAWHDLRNSGCPSAQDRFREQTAQCEREVMARVLAVRNDQPQQIAPALEGR